MRIFGSSKNPYALVLATIFLTSISPINSEVAAAGVLPINLCLAGNYASLSKVLTKGAEVVIHSNTIGTLIGSESPVEADAFLYEGSNLVSQQSYASYTAAISSLRSAIDYVNTDLAPVASTLTQTSLSKESINSGQLGVFPPGIYKRTDAMSIAANETITLSGNSTDKFYFISGAAFVLGANVHVVLNGGAQAKNVYWIIGTFVGDQTAGAQSSIPGNILVDGSITVGAGTHIDGRILAINTITYGAGSSLESLPPDTACLGVVQKSAPTITSVAQISGSTSGGDTITVSGTDFRSGATVSVGGSSCAVSSITSIQIVCLTGSGIFGSVDVVVTNNDGGVATASNSFTFVMPGDIAQSPLSLTIIGGSAGSPILLSTTGGSGLGAITYVVGSSGTATGCASTTVDSSTASLTSTSPGTCSVTATKARALSSGSVYYASISSPPIAFTFIGLRQDTLTVTSTSGIFGTPLSLTTTGGSGGALVTYTFNNGSAVDCLITAGKLTSSRAGTCWVTATKAASGNYAMINSAQTSILLVGMSIVFSETTLVDVTIGAPYSDFIKAEARTDGVFTSTLMTYAVDTSTPLPTGLSLNTSTGYVTGTLPDGTTTGSFSYTFIASSPGFPTQRLAFTVNILPKIILAAPAFTLTHTSDAATAGTVITGYTITSTGGTIASYSISPAAGNGLTFNTSSGLLTGTPTAQALLVTYTISAHNATAPDATQTFAVTVSASGGGGGGGGSGGGGGGGGSTPTPLLSIEFTDQTLRSPTIGVLYSDRLSARTLSNGSPDSHVITYALASGSPDLPLGLILNSTTGFITGIIESSSLPGSVSLLFTASSPGYTSVTTTMLSHLVVQAAEIVPSEVLVADIPATEIVDSQTAIETTSTTISTAKPIQPKNKLMMTALFANNSSILSEVQITAIKTLSKALLLKDIKTITIVGFTNSAPSVGSNKLAIDRARTLARYLKLNGVMQSITIKSIITAKTKANQTASALIALRKAEIWIVS